MVSLSGNSSGSSLLQNSGSEDDLQKLMMDQRKRKRMISNRESARRSRMKKQKQLDDLTAQLAHFRSEKNHIVSSINVNTRLCLNMESENLILRAQVAELSNRLESLNEIISFMNCGSGWFGPEIADGFMSNSLNYMYLNPHIMASAEMLQY
ncbi:bZIP transcription factor 44-like [Actinidia eriantha]|uniref:bZIP transcription factor 44-like n=1 Tax=Actinidia eriantha TaxID=165200 RepID=UPI00258E46A6|nr:bZIP transcription factor 44-like [Actinidia eriantha]